MSSSLPLETEGEQELDTTSNKESQGQLSRHERQLTAPTPFGLDKKRPSRGQIGPKRVQREEERMQSDIWPEVAGGSAFVSFSVPRIKLFFNAHETKH
jgi:hypothetical protein